jgi:phage gp29-like protein
MQRDTGVLIPRVFNFHNGKYGNLPRDDNISLDTYKGMLNDAQVRAGIEVVSLATIGSGWEFNFPYQENPTKADEVLKFIRGVYGNINKTHGLRSDLFQVFNEVLSALWAGFSVTEKVWGKDKKGHWVIKKYKVLPPETVKFNINKQGILSPTEAVEQSYLVQDNIKLPARKVNIFIVNPKFGSPWGESILKPVYNNWYVKDWMVKFHASYMENLGSPILIGKTNRDTVTMNNALQEARNSSVITLNESEEVDLLNAGGSGDDFESAIRYHDAQIMRGMLVPSLLIGQDEAMGSRALSEIHFEMFKLSRIGALQQQLRTWINNDVREMVRLNFGDFDMYPELTFKSWSRSDQQRISTMIVELVNAQVITPNEAWIREFLEIPDAGDDYDPKAFPDRSSVSSPTKMPEDREVPPQVRSPGDDAQRDQLESPDINDYLQPLKSVTSFQDSIYDYPTDFDKKDVHQTLAIILTRGGVALSESERKALELRESVLSDSTDTTTRAYFLGVPHDDGAAGHANE